MGCERVTPAERGPRRSPAQTGRTRLPLEEKGFEFSVPPRGRRFQNGILDLPVCKLPRDNRGGHCCRLAEPHARSWPAGVRSPHVKCRCGGRLRPAVDPCNKAVRRLRAGATGIRTAGPSRETESVSPAQREVPQRRKGLSRERRLSCGGPRVRILFPPPASPLPNRTSLDQGASGAGCTRFTAFVRIGSMRSELRTKCWSARAL